ncbi:MAG TPA: VCBS repeat-containing protein, partial [Flavisolibacter sp.]
TLEQIPEVKLHNYAFRNEGDVKFNDETEDWGLTKPTFSNGAAYADLDNDGDMDMVINNINDEALLYENTVSGSKSRGHHLTVKLAGNAANRNGIGAWVEVYYGNNRQVYEQTPYRGYLSTIQLAPHFGLGNVEKVDSLIVKWPSGKLQKVFNVAADRVVEVKESAADMAYTWVTGGRAGQTLLRDITTASGLGIVHQQNDFIDFNIQKLLPHKFSEYGPALAVGDIDGNGLEDLVMGGSASHGGIAALQQNGGGFLKKQWSAGGTAEQRWMDMGLALFDADGDSDLDLYVARGGYESAPGSTDYQDGLLLNDGAGNFTISIGALPVNTTSKSCVRVADWDKDGDLDLFVAGRVEPWNYPKAVGSIVLRNDSKGGKVQFTDVTKAAAPALVNAGLVCDAVWTDFDGDGWQDLLLAGEWMPLRFLKNEKGTFKEVTEAAGTGRQKGWWTSILPGDFDNDGDMDYIAGNLGLNSFFKATPERPVKIYAKDFDGNGSYDAVPTLYLKAAHAKPEYAEFPAHTRDDMTKQLISFKSKFQNYKSYALAPFSQMLKPEEAKDALVLEANHLSNSFVRNLGGGKFEVVPLPSAAQYACLNGMLAEDFDGDGNLDLLLNGNDYGSEPTVGRYDACNGLLMRGDGKGNFSALSILQSGWFVPGNGKSLVKLRGAAGQTMVAASQNRGALKLYEMKKAPKTISLLPDEVAAVIHFKNGKTQKVEAGYGASFLSQSGRFLNIDDNMTSVDVINGKGNKRIVRL